MLSFSHLHTTARNGLQWFNIFLLLYFLKLLVGPFVPDALIISVIVIFKALLSLILKAKALNDNDDNDE